MEKEEQSKTLQSLDWTTDSNLKPQHIVIWADCLSTGISYDYGKRIYQHETTIKQQTWNELQKWVEAYDDIILMDKPERERNIEKINLLDQQGINLAQQISSEWTNNSLPIKYYSEGLMAMIEFTH